MNHKTATKLIDTHYFKFTDDNGGEQFLLNTQFIDNGDPEPILHQTFTLQSYCNSASFELIGARITPEKLRQLADELDEKLKQIRAKRSSGWEWAIAKDCLSLLQRENIKNTWYSMDGWVYPRIKCSNGISFTFTMHAHEVYVRSPESKDDREFSLNTGNLTTKISQWLKEISSRYEKTAISEPDEKSVSVEAVYWADVPWRQIKNLSEFPHHIGPAVGAVGGTDYPWLFVWDNKDKDGSLLSVEVKAARENEAQRYNFEEAFAIYRYHPEVDCYALYHIPPRTLQKYWGNLTKKNQK